MRRLILIIPDWLAPLGGESVLRQPLPGLHRLTEVGQIAKLNPIHETTVPEAAFLGMNPYEIHLSQGALMVSALGFDPPERSVHFHLSLMSLDGNSVLHRLKHTVTPELSKEIMTLLKPINAPSLIVLPGMGEDHALVWEDGSIDLGCLSPSEAAGKPYKQALPDGDGDTYLRRLIDDSVNILAEQEFNQRRIDQELEPINIVWPWGPGFRMPVPNLLIKTGPVHVESPSLRLKGLAQMARYRHGNIGSFGQGTAVRLESLLASTKEHACSILLLPNIGEFQSAGSLEELDWLTREIDRRLIVPLMEEMATGELQLTLLSPRIDPTLGYQGLMLRAESHRSGQNVYPFDERSLEERSIPAVDLWEAVEDGIRWIERS